MAATDLADLRRPTELEPNPFDYPRAQHLPYSAEQVVDQFVPFGWMPRFMGNRITCVVGARGTGKSMALRFAAAQAQAIDFKNGARATAAWDEGERVDFARVLKFLGVYLYVNPLAFSSLPETLATKEWRKLLFGHYFNAYAAESLLQTLIDLRDRGALRLPSSAENRIAAVAARRFSSREVEGLEGSRDAAAAARSAIEQSIGPAIAAHDRTILMLPLTPLGEPLRELAAALTAEGPLERKSVFFLLDEYHNFTANQQLLMNTLLKSAASPLMFKIAMLPFGFAHLDTLNPDEPLRVGHDYEQIDTNEGIFEPKPSGRHIPSPRREFDRVVTAIAQKRLATHPHFRRIGRTNWADFLETVSPEQEALQAMQRHPDAAGRLRERLRATIGAIAPANSDIDAIVDELWIPEEPLRSLVHSLDLVHGKASQRVKKLRLLREEVRNYRNKEAQSRRYRTAYGKYGYALLFQLLRILREDKVYAGIDTLITLSSGIVRDFLELCYHVYEMGAGGGALLEDNQRISASLQSAGARRAAQVFLDEIAARRPHGPAVRDLAEGLGRLFRDLHVEDERVREAEPTHFKVDMHTLSSGTQQVLRSALRLSVLHQKPSALDKQAVIVRPQDYVLTRILVPRYRISERVRGPIRLLPAEVEAMASGKGEPEVRAAERRARDRLLGEPTESPKLF